MLILVVLYVVWFAVKIIFIIGFCAANLLKDTSFAKSVFLNDWLFVITLLVIDFIISVIHDTPQAYNNNEEIHQCIQNHENSKL